jgi:hypothetical protein
VHWLVPRGRVGEHVNADAPPLELEKLGENERLGELREIPEYVANRGLKMVHGANTTFQSLPGGSGFHVSDHLPARRNSRRRRLDCLPAGL